MNLDEKRKKFLELVERIEPKADYYVSKLDNPFFNKFLRLFILREKIIIKGFAVLMYKLLGIKIIKKAKLFYGKEFYTFLYNADASSLCFFGTLYGEEIKIIKFLIKNLNENDIFYDIGANYGFYTCLAKEFIHSGEIHSFEPLPQIFEFLSKNVSNNKNVYLNQLALNNYDGQVEFYDRSLNRHSGGSSLINLHKLSNKIIVNCLKLDSYIQTHKPPTIIKIDVEGAEYLVLEGGGETLKKYQPTIIMEFMVDEYHLKAVKLLFELGYKMYFLTKDGDLDLANDKESDDILKGIKKAEANYIFKK